MSSERPNTENGLCITCDKPVMSDMDPDADAADDEFVCVRSKSYCTNRGQEVNWRERWKKVVSARVGEKSVTIELMRIEADKLRAELADERQAMRTCPHCDFTYGQDDNVVKLMDIAAERDAYRQALQDVVRHVEGDRVTLAYYLHAARELLK